MNKLKEYVSSIISDIIIPIMMITEKDINCFETEPVEYIRNSDDYDETLVSPRS